MPVAEPCPPDRILGELRLFRISVPGVVSPQTSPSEKSLTALKKWSIEGGRPWGDGAGVGARGCGQGLGRWPSAQPRSTALSPATAPTPVLAQSGLGTGSWARVGARAVAGFPNPGHRPDPQQVDLRVVGGGSASVRELSRGKWSKAEIWGHGSRYGVIGRILARSSDRRLEPHRSSIWRHMSSYELKGELGDSNRLKSSNQAKKPPILKRGEKRTECAPRCHSEKL